MTTIGQVMAATDLSGPARYAIERARRVAATTGAGCTAVHVLSEGALAQLRQLLGGHGGPVEERLAAAAAERLGQQLQASTGAPGDVVQRVLVGPVVDTLVCESRALGAGLVVLGARGEGFLRHLVLGTTAERVLRKSSRPVLVVRQRPHDAYRRVLVAVDFSTSSLAALRLAGEVAPQAERVLLHASELPFEGKLRYAGVDDVAIARYRRDAEQEAMRRLEEFAAAAGLGPAQARLVVASGEASRVILEQAEECGCDLLAVGKRGRSVVEELLMGSVTKHLLAEATTDLLVTSPSTPEG